MFGLGNMLKNGVNCNKLRSQSRQLLPYDLAVRRLKIDGRIDTAPPIQTISVNHEIVIRTRMMGAVNHEVGPPALDFCTMTG